MAFMPIAMQGQTANIMLPSEAKKLAADAQASVNRNAMFDMEVQDRRAAADSKRQLNALYQASGGDMEKMLKSGGLDMDTAMQLQQSMGEQRKLSAQADKEGAQADKYRLQAGLEKLNFGSQLLAGATPENWNQIRTEFGNLTGQDLGEQYDQGKVQTLMQQGLSMKDRLANEWKQKGYELDVAQLGEQQRHNMAGEARMSANAGGNSSSKAPSGYKWADDGQSLEPIKGGPADKSSTVSQPVKLSATAEKELFESEDMVLAGSNVSSAIDSALQLNDKAYSGFGAAERAAARSNLPGQSEEADATIQMNNIILGQALESLKTTFGGAPTEGERKILVDLQASVDKTPAQRKAILERAKMLADKRVEYNKRKAESLRSGSFRTEGISSPESQPPVTQQPRLSGADADAAAWAQANPNDLRSAAILKRLGL